MEKAHIYAIKTGDTCHYIGKTIRENQNGEIKKSMLGRLYSNPELRETLVDDKDLQIQSLKLVDLKDWYDEKLLEVVEKYRDSHPLKNAKWMLEGKRGYWHGTGGYWLGKTRDANTLKQLSTSKYKRVVQYDISGNYVKTWESRKAVAIQVLKDYKIINGSAESRIYKVLSKKSVNKRRYAGSYWFGEDELQKAFGAVPKKLNYEAIRAAEKQRRKAIRKKQEILYTTRYTVQRLSENGELVRTYDNTSHCAYELRIPLTMVQRICRGQISNNNYLLRYGKKKRQLANTSYPRYRVVIKKNRKPKKTRVYKDIFSTRTYKSVVLYDKQGTALQTFLNTSVASRELGVTETLIRQICTYGFRKENRHPVLRYGVKRRVYGRRKK